MPRESPGSDMDYFARTMDPANFSKNARFDEIDEYLAIWSNFYFRNVTSYIVILNVVSKIIP